MNWHEVTQIFSVVDCVRQMTAKIPVRMAYMEHSSVYSFCLFPVLFRLLACSPPAPPPLPSHSPQRQSTLIEEKLCFFSTVNWCDCFRIRNSLEKLHVICLCHLGLPSAKVPGNFACGKNMEDWWLTFSIQPKQCQPYQVWKNVSLVWIQIHDSRYHLNSNPWQ